MKRQISEMMLKKYINSSMVLPAYHPAADFEWIRTQSLLPWLPLQIDIPHLAIAREIKLIEHLLVDHRDDYAEHVGWKSFCIHGKSYDSTRESVFYDDTRPMTWTQEAEDFMPITTDFFKHTWPSAKYDRLRVMFLQPGGHVAAHSDYDDPHLYPINIAITQPDECFFVMEKHGIVPFRPGSAIWLDISNRHTVFNRSSEPRWHIIVHQDFGHDGFQDLVVRSYHQIYGVSV